MAKATIVSFVPFPITEEKPGVYPGYFHIPPCRDVDIPNLLVIGDSKYHVEIDADRTVTVPCPAPDMARSIVNDYLISNLEYSVEHESMPAIFWVEGERTWEQIQKNNAEQIVQVRQYQLNWFRRLVTLADDDWERTRQHRAITDTQRHAARALGLSRPWIIPTTAERETKKFCIACRSEVHPEAVVCQNCRAILNIVEYSKLQFSK
jgi:hypothetical protein